MRLVVATHNPAKAREMREILTARFPTLELLTLADFDGAPSPAEVGDDYVANARIKSESAANFTGEWSVADDAGLEIDALDGAPGLHSKRFAGESTPFPEKMRLILDKLAGVPDHRRCARFRCAVTLTSPDGGTEAFEATCEGAIAHEQVGIFGFGYDPIFFLPEMGRHMAELTPEEKHKISHRGKVLRALSERLAQLLDA